MDAWLNKQESADTATKDPSLQVFQKMPYKAVKNVTKKVFIEEHFLSSSAEDYDQI